MTSTRLPGKVMRDLAGAPMIVRQIERLRRCRRLDALVVATSDEPSDDPLADAMQAACVDVFRGSLSDVLGRFVAALDAFDPADNVLRLTADCPLAEPAVIDALVDLHLERGTDYASNVVPTRTFAHGLDAEIVRTDVLRTAAREAIDAYDREHVTPFVNRRPERFPQACLTQATDDSQLRWTVDTPDDFAFVQEVYSALHPADPLFGASEVKALVASRPDLQNLGGYPRG